MKNTFLVHSSFFCQSGARIAAEALASKSTTTYFGMTCSVTYVYYPNSFVSLSHSLELVALHLRRRRSAVFAEERRRAETKDMSYALCLIPEDSPYAYALYLPPQPHLAHRNRSISKLRRGLVSSHEPKVVVQSVNRRNTVGRMCPTSCDAC